jgi:hypothetical protein
MNRSDSISKTEAAEKFRRCVLRNMRKFIPALVVLAAAAVWAVNSQGSPALAAQAQPTIAKDTLQMTAFTFGSYKGNYDVWGWAPLADFRVNGPVPSGGQLYVEYTTPGSSAVRFDCHTEETAAGDRMHAACGGRDGVPEEKASVYTGIVPFSIKMRNELAGSDLTLFTGKMKVGKYHSNEAQNPKTVNHYVYYVDQDWTLPIGYLIYNEDTRKGMDRPVLNVAFWVRGDPYNFQPHLFYQGKEVGKIFYGGDEVGKASCDNDIEDTTTMYVADSVPQKAKWTLVRCEFGNVRGWDKTGEAPGMFGPLYQLDKNPGEYEFKLLWNNHLARSIKFTVGPGGKIDNGVAAANKLGSERVIVPVQLIGDQDGAWDKAAWKTDAFYGNPLTGFSASQ